MLWGYGGDWRQLAKPRDIQSNPVEYGWQDAEVAEPYTDPFAGNGRFIVSERAAVDGEYSGNCNWQDGPIRNFTRV